MLEPTQEKDTPMEQSSSREPDDLWVVHADRSSDFAGSEVGLLLLRPKRFITEYALRFDFLATNNEAEYEDLIVRLRIAKEFKV